MKNNSSFEIDNYLFCISDNIPKFYESSLDAGSGIRVYILKDYKIFTI